MRGWEAVGQKRFGKINHELNATIIKYFWGGEKKKRGKPRVGLHKWVFCLGCS